MNSDFSDFIRFFPIFRLFPTFRLLDSTTLLVTHLLREGFNKVGILRCWIQRSWYFEILSYCPNFVEPFPQE